MKNWIAKITIALSVLLFSACKFDGGSIDILLNGDVTSSFTVSGTVTNTSGEAIEGYVTQIHEVESGQSVFRNSPKTDVNGQYNLEYLPRNIELEIHVFEGTGHGDYMGQRKTFTIEDKSLMFDFVLEDVRIIEI
jgi:hypothetical protein